MRIVGNAGGIPMTCVSSFQKTVSLTLMLSFLVPVQSFAQSLDVVRRQNYLYQQTQFVQQFVSDYSQARLEYELKGFKVLCDTLDTPEICQPTFQKLINNQLAYEKLPVLKLSDPLSVEWVAGTDKMKLTFIDDQKFLIQVNKQKAVWNVADSSEKNFKAISDFVNRSLISTKNPTAWLKFLNNVVGIPEAHASRGTKIALALTVTAIAIAVYLARKTAKQMEKVGDETKAQVRRVGNETVVQVRQVGETTSASIEKVTNEATQTMQTAEASLNQVTQDTSQVLNSSAEAIREATNGIRTNSAAIQTSTTQAIGNISGGLKMERGSVHR